MSHLAAAVVETCAASPTEPTLSVNVAAGGRSWIADAAPGFSIMEIIRAFGIPMKAECGGSAVCSTCHVRVPEDWAARLPAASDEELARLDEIAGADERSRLACQIRMHEDLDSLEVEVQPDSIALHAAFLAG